MLGAGGMAIAFLLSREFLKILTLAVCIGAPLSYLVNNLWLERFPNRVEFGIGTVLLGTCMILMPGLFTIGSQVVQAVKNNPVDSLKME